MRHYPIIYLIVILFSCEKDNTSYSDEYYYYNFYKELDSSGRTIKYSKTFENDVLIEIGEYYYGIDTIVFKKFNSNHLLFEKIIYYTNHDGFALNSVDTIYGDNMAIKKSSYKYENNYLIETDEYIYRFENKKIDSFYVKTTNEYSNDNLIKQIHSVNGFDCTDIINKWQTNPSVGNLELFGKSTNLIRYKVLNTGCPCGPSSEPATQEFNYTFDKDNRINKQVETYICCHHVGTGPITREITSISYKYYNR